MSQNTTNLEDLENLRRFLYLHSEKPFFASGNLDVYFNYSETSIESLDRLLKANDATVQDMLNIIQDVSEKGATVTSRRALLYALAYATCNVTLPTLKHKIMEIASKVIADVEELHRYIKYTTLRNKKFGSALNKLVCKFYLSMNPQALAFEVTKSKGYHSWTHKDLIKLCHPKMTDGQTAVVLTYVMFDLKNATNIIESLAIDNTETQGIINYLSQMDELKRCENEARIVELIKKINVTNINRVPSFYHKTVKIWEAMLPLLSTSEIVDYLPRMYKLMLLKATSPIHSKIIEALEKQKITDPRLKPVQVFINLKFLEKGGKDPHPQLVAHLKSKGETVPRKEAGDEASSSSAATKTNESDKKSISTALLYSLYKTLNLSFGNEKPIRKSFCISVDVTPRMNKPCLSCKSVSCYEAAVYLIQWIVSKSEKPVTVGVFNGKTLPLINLDKQPAYSQKFNKLRNGKCGIMNTATPLHWAEQNRKSYDVFLQLVHHQNLPKNVDTAPSSDVTLVAFQKYKTNMKKPNTKLIMCTLGSIRTRSVYKEKNYLDICGFNPDVPKIIQAFAEGLFS